MTQLFDRNRRIQAASDLEGLTLGTTAPERSVPLTASLHAKVVAMGAGEVTEALSEGRVDVAELRPSFVVQTKTLAPTSIVQANYRPIVAVVATTKDVWDKWSFQIQTVIAEEVKAAAFKITTQAVQQDGDALSALKERGFTPVRLSPEAFESFRTLARPGWPQEKLQDLLDLVTDALQQWRRTTNPVERRTRVPTTQTDILFATDRIYDPSADARYRFGSKRDEALRHTARYGVATFTRDPARPAGIGPDSDSRFDAQPFRSRDEFLDALNSRLEAARQKEVLIYVHGYNNKFLDATVSATFLASDFNFVGVPVLFSWPSEGNFLHYPGDEDQVRLSRDAFVELVQLIKEIKGLQKLHLLVHSMGSRLGVYGIEWLDLQKAIPRPVFHHLIFAAPDVFVTEFDFALSRLRNQSNRITLYVSERDRPLECSMTFHNGNARAGQAGAHIVPRVDVDTIDVTLADPQQPASAPCRGNHSYIFENEPVITDLHQLVNLDAPPDRRRRLYPQSYGPSHYWILRP
jgi:esterase/lipase superfamily enzyme